MKAARMWQIELESGEKFTLEADTRAEAIEKAIRWRPRKTKVHKVENIAELIARKKYQS